MADANVFVDHFPEAPAQVEAQLNQIFAPQPWTEHRKKLIETLTNQYCEECRVLAKKCAGENEWRGNLFLGLLQPLVRLDPEIMMLSASEKPWLSSLKPTAPSPYELISHSAYSMDSAIQPSTTSSTTPGTPQSRPPASVFPNTPTFSVLSTTPSDVSSDSPNGLLTSKPDITLGLAHTSFTSVQRRVLMLLQDDKHLISEPHQTQIGLRFPFLIVESKGGAAGGNMISAQNQAAVDGACALNILGDFQDVVTRIIPTPTHAQSANEDDGKQEEQDTSQPILFSVTTEGPLHEIWVHYRLGEAYHMTCYRAWRITRHQDACEFVHALANIVEWGLRGFRECVLHQLEQTERPVLEGILAQWDDEG